MFEPSKTLADIVPEARGKFEEFLAVATELGFGPKIRSAGRTCADQQAISASGATHAALCRSWHVLGRAIDIDVSPPTCEAYTKLGEIWEDMGGIWGGRFPGFGSCGDMGHFEYATTPAVPEAVCPSGISVDECEAIREEYLSSAFEKRFNWGALTLFAVLVGGVCYFAWRK